MEAWRSELVFITASVARRVLLVMRTAQPRSWGDGIETSFTALEDMIWQEASSCKGYCECMATTAAEMGDEGCLRVLHELGGEAAASVAAADEEGLMPAHYAASNGRKGFLRVLHELGGEAAASLVAADANGCTPTHHAAHNGHEGCLRMLHELGGDAAVGVAAADAKGYTPAHLAAFRGHDGFLRVLHELGGDAAASLVACIRTCRSLTLSLHPAVALLYHGGPVRAG